MSILGVGPGIMFSGLLAICVLLYIRTAYSISISLPESFSTIRIGTGILLAIIGFCIWLPAVVMLKREFSRGKLLARGSYSITRNPIYAAGILFFLPSIILFSNEFLLIIADIAMLIVFKLSIVKEEDFLSDKFGKDYEKYRKNVPLLIPSLKKTFKLFFNKQK